MNFDFPANKLESVIIQLRQQHIERVRQIAQRYNCSPLDIYLTLVEEALREYEHREVAGLKAWKEQFTHPDAAPDRLLATPEGVPEPSIKSWNDVSSGTVSDREAKQRDELYARLFPREPAKPKKPAKSGSRPVVDTKSCLRCGKQITQKPSEGERYWSKKKYCSKTCGARARWHTPKKADEQDIKKLIEYGKPLSIVRYCQNSTCPKPEHKYAIGTGVEWAFHSELLRFCGEQCKEEFLERNGEKTADEEASTIL